MLKGSELITKLRPKNAESTYKKWYPLVKKVNKNFGLPESLILAVIQKESAGDSGAIGDKGKSIGLMQVSQPALTDVNYHYGLSYDLEELKTDPELQIYIGSAFLAINNELAKNTIYIDSLFTAIRAYNVGFRKAVEYSNAGKLYAMDVKNKQEIFDKLIKGG